jgi:hypothetical protein
MTSKAKKNDGTKATLDVAQVKSVLMAQPDFLQPVVQAAVQSILEVEMEVCLLAGKHERSEQRLGYRSGYYRRRRSQRSCAGMSSALRASARSRRSWMRPASDRERFCFRRGLVAAALPDGRAGNNGLPKLLDPLSKWRGSWRLLTRMMTGLKSGSYKTAQSIAAV